MNLTLDMSARTVEYDARERPTDVEHELPAGYRLGCSIPLVGGRRLARVERVRPNMHRRHDRTWTADAPAGLTFVSGATVVGHSLDAPTREALESMIDVCLLVPCTEHECDCHETPNEET